MAVSMASGSSLSSRSAVSAAASSTAASSASPNGAISPTVSWLQVSVPVLSAHSTSMPAISSMATSRETMAFIRARRSAPMAMVTDSTAGRATGMAATVRMSTKRMVSSAGAWRNSETTTISATSPSVPKIRKLPMRSTARWKWERPLPAWTSWAVRPK